MASWTIKFITLICKLSQIRKKYSKFSKCSDNLVCVLVTKKACKYGQVPNFRKLLGMRLVIRLICKISQIFKIKNFEIFRMQ